MSLPKSVPLPSSEDETPSTRVEIDLGALSHKGNVRPENEDHFLVVRLERTMRALLTSLPPGQIPEQYADTAYGMVVADGMGGAAAGEIASQLAISSLVDLVLRTPDWIMRFDEQRAREVLLRFDKRFQQVAQLVADRAKAIPELLGMGTTMTTAASLGADLVIAHVGDSRIYLFRDRRLYRLTRDHTVAQALADAGAIPSDTVDSHPMRHMLTQSIGGSETQAELGLMRLIDGDQVLLCSDGLTEVVSDDAICAVLGNSSDSASACKALVESALANGGPDNVTVVLARYRIPG
jgi:protein phosphatase